MQYVSPVTDVKLRNSKKQNRDSAPYAANYNHPNADAQGDTGMKYKRNKTSKGEKIVAGSKFN